MYFRKYKISYDWLDLSKNNLMIDIKPNPKIPNLSELVRLEYSDDQGRYLVVSRVYFSLCSLPKRKLYVQANRHIGIGQVLLVEKPFASVLLPHCYDTYCHQCQISLPRDFVP